MIESEDKQEKRRGFFGRINNNGVPSLNEQNRYNPDTRDWEHRKYRLKDKFLKGNVCILHHKLR